MKYDYQNIPEMAKGYGVRAELNDIRATTVPIARTDTTPKYLNFPLSKGKKGGTRISRVIATDNETYHSKRGNV